MNKKQHICLLFDHNIWIEIHKEIYIRNDFSFFVRLNSVCQSGIMRLHYTNLNLIEIVRSNKIIQIFQMFEIISRINNLYYFDIEKKRSIPSSKKDLINRGIGALFEDGHEESVASLKEMSREKAVELPEELPDRKVVDFDRINDLIKKINFEQFRKNLGANKGEFNYLSPFEAMEIFEGKYKKYYEKIKDMPEARDLPENLFDRSYYEKAAKHNYSDIGFEVLKLNILEFCGYKQKSKRKMSGINSFVDSSYVAIAKNFNLLVTSDQKMLEKVSQLGNKCMAMSYADFKEMLFVAKKKIT